MGASLSSIAAEIIAWGDRHPRELPWKETGDPYKIWISEIILQQTQVAQGIPYYQRFIRKLPTVHHLAAASEDEVLRLWQGLGYNSRARNLHYAAQTIMRRHDGHFPTSYEDILALKGIGPYTAAAISSFAFGLRKPVLDSNVIRVLSRVFGISDVSTDPIVRRHMYDILDEMIAAHDPAMFNQSMMNFGAMVCSAKKPECAGCPVSNQCIAFNQGLVELLPVRPARGKRRTRFLHYLFVHDKHGAILQRRQSSDIWANMFEFPVIEARSWRKPRSLRDFLKQVALNDSVVILDDMRLSQTLTHQVICCRFYRIPVKRIASQKLAEGLRFELFENLEKFAFPKVIRSYLDDIGIQISKTHWNIHD